MKPAEVARLVRLNRGMVRVLMGIVRFGTSGSHIITSRGLRAITVLLLALFAWPVASHAQSFETDYTPRVLSDTDIRIYQQIFVAQDKGDWKKADSLIKQARNTILMGYVDFQRYMHPTAYTSKYTELKEWLDAYNDHPDMAPRIYNLAKRRQPKGYKSPQRPKSKKYRPEPDRVYIPHFDKQGRSRAQKKRVAQINRYVKSLLARERPTQSLKYIRTKDVSDDLTKLEFDRIKSWIAAQYFFERVPNKAYDTAIQVVERNREAVPMADWTAGLAAWEMGNYQTAAGHFEALTAAKHVNNATRSAGAYWAARAALVNRQPQKVSRYLEIAANAPFTFYGVLANRQLGNDHAYDWKAPVLTQAGYNKLLDYPAIERAVALWQLGRAGDAEKELRRIHAYVDEKLDIHHMALARVMNLPAAQLQIAEYAKGPGFDTGLYPVPDYRPDDGFHVDRALIYAFMRKESKFDPNAKSWAGARGLMQLMPRTASSLAKDKSLRSSKNTKLYDPGFNLNLGQKYVEQLMRSADPTGNLFQLTVAYNGGPGNLRKWRKELTSDKDPFFFIESIPSGETRGFIEGVLTNFWIYRNRLGQHSPSLDAAAAGKWPIYKSIEPGDGRVALR